MDWVAYISTVNMAIAAISIITGLLLGWVIWGGQKKYIHELEDSLAVTRSRTQAVALNSVVDDKAEEGIEYDDDVSQTRTPQTSISQTNIPQARIYEREDLSGDYSHESLTRDDPDVQSVTSQELPSYDPTLSNAPLSDTKNEVLVQQNKSLQRQSLQELSDELQKIRILLKKQTYSETDDLKEHIDETDNSIKRANGRVGLILRSLDKPTTDD